MKLVRLTLVIFISFILGLGVGWYFSKPYRLRVVNQLPSGSLTVRFTHESRDADVTQVLPDIPAQSSLELAFQDVIYLKDVEGAVGDRRFPAPSRKLLRREATVYTLTENGWTVEPTSW